MSENFKKIKSEYLTAAIVKSVLIALSGGNLTCGLLLLFTKLKVISLEWYFCLIIGLGVALAAGAVTFIILRPVAKKLAKQLDERYCLNEKARTMLAFSGEEGDILTLQRQDTDEKLASLPKNKLYKNLWIYIVAYVLSLAMLFFGIFLPIKEAEKDAPEEPPIGPSEDDDPAYVYDLSQQSAVYDLMNDVRSSSLDEQLKNAFIAELEALDSTLQTVDKKSVMLTTVYGAINGSDAITEDANSFREICAKLAEYGETYISGAIKSGIAAYRSRNLSLLEYSMVAALENLNGDDIEQVFEEALTQSRDTLKITQTEGLDTESSALAALITLSLNDSGIAETDALYSSLKTFAAGVKAVSDKCNKGYGDSTLQSDLDSAYANFKTIVVNAVSGQSYNCIMNDFVRRKLADIFDISLNDLTDPLGDLVNGGSGGSGEGEGGSGSGGWGEGDEKYGSDELIYDPDTGERVKYGTVLEEKYLGMVYDRTLSGELPDDVVDYINSYFDKLYNGIQDSDTEEGS